MYLLLTLACIMVCRGIEANSGADYIIGLGYYELAGETITLNAPSNLPKNTAIVITLYEAYHPGFRQQYAANVKIEGPGAGNIKHIIWSTYKSLLYFQVNTSSIRIQREAYAGHTKESVNNVAQKEFGKKAHIVYSSYKSPAYIDLNGGITTPTTTQSTTQSMYVVGLEYYELGGKTVSINIPETIPKNTVLVITLYNAYHPGFRQYEDTNVNIVGAGKENVKTIIWSTYNRALHFTTDATTKKLPYAGYKEASVNQVALKEFGKNADVTFSAYKSPVDIIIAYSGTEAPVTTPAYIVGLAYYELGDKTVNLNISSSIPHNTALVITLYEAYHPGFRQQYDANVNIHGLGKNHIKTIIWSTYNSVLHFTTDATTKKLPYAGYKEASVNQVAQKEFGKDANVILSAYKSPVNINIR